MHGLNENVPVQDVFCSGLGAIERLEGGCLRFYMYVSQIGEDGEVQEKQVVAKIIMPASAIPEAMLRTAAAIDDPAVKMIHMIADAVH